MTDLQKRSLLKIAALTAVASAALVGCGKKEEPAPVVAPAPVASAPAPKPAPGKSRAFVVPRRQRQRFASRDDSDARSVAELEQCVESLEALVRAAQTAKPEPPTPLVVAPEKVVPLDVEQMLRAVVGDYEARLEKRMRDFAFTRLGRVQ